MEGFLTACTYTKHVVYPRLTFPNQLYNKTKGPWWPAFDQQINPRPGTDDEAVGKAVPEGSFRCENREAFGGNEGNGHRKRRWMNEEQMEKASIGTSFATGPQKDILVKVRGNFREEC